MSSTNSQPIAPGGLKEFLVCSRRIWNNTGILLEAGITYESQIDPKSRWYDFYISTTANGYAKDWLRPYEKDRRVPDQNWFRLIGATNQNLLEMIVFSTGTNSFKTLASGPLFCFANDMSSMYWNNWGSLRVILYRPLLA